MPYKECSKRSKRADKTSPKMQQWKQEMKQEAEKVKHGARLDTGTHNFLTDPAYLGLFYRHLGKALKKPLNL
jgi:hypothetical protein